MVSELKVSRSIVRCPGRLSAALLGQHRAVPIGSTTAVLRLHAASPKSKWHVREIRSKIYKAEFVPVVYVRRPSTICWIAAFCYTSPICLIVLGYRVQQGLLPQSSPSNLLDAAVLIDLKLAHVLYQLLHMVQVPRKQSDLTTSAILREKLDQLFDLWSATSMSKSALFLISQLLCQLDIYYQLERLPALYPGLNTGSIRATYVRWFAAKRIIVFDSFQFKVEFVELDPSCTTVWAQRRFYLRHSTMTRSFIGLSYLKAENSSKFYSCSYSMGDVILLQLRRTQFS